MCCIFIYVSICVSGDTHVPSVCRCPKSQKESDFLVSKEGAADCLFLLLGPERGSPGTLSSAFNHWAYLRPGGCLLYFLVIVG